MKEMQTKLTHNLKYVTISAKLVSKSNEKEKDLPMLYVHQKRNTNGKHAPEQHGFGQVCLIFETT